MFLCEEGLGKAIIVVLKQGCQEETTAQGTVRLIDVIRT